MSDYTGTDSAETFRGELDRRNTAMLLAGGDIAYGGELLDQIYGGSGNDHFYADSGNDLLYG